MSTLLNHASVVSREHSESQGTATASGPGSLKPSGAVSEMLARETPRGREIRSQVFLPLINLHGFICDKEKKKGHFIHNSINRIFKNQVKRKRKRKKSMKVSM